MVPHFIAFPENDSADMFMDVMARLQIPRNGGRKQKAFDKKFIEPKQNELDGEERRRSLIDAAWHSIGEVFLMSQMRLFPKDPK